MAILIRVVDLVVILSEASSAWAAVVAGQLLGAFLAIIVASSSVDGTGLVGDFVLGHPLESVVGLTSVAAVVSGAGDEDLWGDVDVWPGGVSLDLDSV
jgi:hypothetical protein